MDPQDISKLKVFVSLVESKPELLHAPQLAFFKKYLEKLNATIPPAPPKSESEEAEEEQPKAEEVPPKAEEVPPEPESDPESDIELDNSGVVEKDEDLELDQGDQAKKVNEDDLEKAGELRSQAQQALGEGKVDESLKLWTEAIKVNPQSAVFFAKRAQCLVKLQKPFNAIKDCSKAIELNPDQALAYRLRGRAHALLGNWEQAALDLNTSLRIDYNEEGDQWLKEVNPNAKKLHDHKRKYERKREEKELRERKERIRRAQEERQKAAESEAAGFGGFPGGMPDGFPGGMPGGMPGGFPGGMPGGFPGGMPGGFPGGMPGGGKGAPDMGMFSQFMSDPDIQEGLSDPEIAAALQEMSKDPSSLLKNQSNPKVMAFMAKMSSKMGFKPQ